jgi:RNA polymerase sigma factor (sigma-70 family)
VALVASREADSSTMPHDSAHPLEDPSPSGHAHAFASGVRRREPDEVSALRDSMDRYLADLDRADQITPEQEVSLARAFGDAVAECLVITLQEGVRVEAQPGRSSRDEIVCCVSRLWRLLDEHAEAAADARRAEFARLVEEELGADAATLARARCAMAEMRDEAIRLRSVMTRANLALVVHMAKAYNGRGVPLADLIQEGNIALMHAVERFDPERGCRLGTYASAWLQRAMYRTVRSLSRTVRLPESARHATSRSVPIDEPMGEGRPSLTDVLIEPEAIAPDDEAARQQIRERARAHLEELGGHEAFVVRRRFGIGHEGPMTLREIGEELGLTRERVRQIEKAALDKLRRRMRQLASP